MGTTTRVEEILKKHLDKHGVAIGKMYTKYLIDAMEEYRQSEIDELTKEVERLRNSKELFEKRCVNLSKSTDEILEYLIPFVDNNLDDNDINRIIKWHNDNSNRH